MCVCMQTEYIKVRGNMCAVVHVCGGQSTTLKSLLSPSIIWIDRTQESNSGHQAQ